MDDWNPIKTAPKDGTHILAWEGGYIFSVWWDENSQNWKDIMWHNPLAPSHWMPLPHDPIMQEWD